MPPASFSFRPGKRIDGEFIRLLRQMAVRARALMRHPAPTDSIHETRVLIKRLRALLWFAKHTFPSSDLRQAKSHLRKASHLLASQRDLAVVHSTLKILSHDMSNHKDREILARISRNPVSRQAAHKKPDRSLQQAFKILLATIEQIERSAKNRSPWPSPSSRLAKAFHAAKKAGKKALNDGKAGQLHIWRKKVKRLLYQLQMTHPTPSHRTKCVIKRIDKLQNALGDYHDSVMVQNHLQKNPLRQMPKTLVDQSMKFLEKRKERLQKKARKSATLIELK